MNPNLHAISKCIKKGLLKKFDDGSFTFLKNNSSQHALEAEKMVSEFYDALEAEKMVSEFYEKEDTNSIDSQIKEIVEYKR